MDGALLFSGMISLPSWNGSLGDCVYTSELSPETDETEVIRYRLIEPFQ